jgi:hypothetical protein
MGWLGHSRTMIGRNSLTDKYPSFTFDLILKPPFVREIKEKYGSVAV